jgi:hypothetical protein
MSLLTLNLVAGYAFGVIRSNVWPREFVTLTHATVTVALIVSISRWSRGFTRVQHYISTDLLG